GAPGHLEWQWIAMLLQRGPEGARAPLLEAPLQPALDAVAVHLAKKLGQGAGIQTALPELLAGRGLLSASATTSVLKECAHRLVAAAETAAPSQSVLGAAGVGAEGFSPERFVCPQAEARRRLRIKKLAGTGSDALLEEAYAELLAAAAVLSWTSHDVCANPAPLAFEAQEDVEDGDENEEEADVRSSAEADGKAAQGTAGAAISLASHAEQLWAAGSRDPGALLTSRTRRTIRMLLARGLRAELGVVEEAPCPLGADHIRGEAGAVLWAAQADQALRRTCTDEGEQEALLEALLAPCHGSWGRWPHWERGASGGSAEGGTPEEESDASLSALACGVERAVAALVQRLGVELVLSGRSWLSAELLAAAQTGAISKEQQKALEEQLVRHAALGEEVLTALLRGAEAARHVSSEGGVEMAAACSLLATARRCGAAHVPGMVTAAFCSSAATWCPLSLEGNHESSEGHRRLLLALLPSMAPILRCAGGDELVTFTERWIGASMNLHPLANCQGAAVEAAMQTLEVVCGCFPEEGGLKGRVQQREVDQLLLLVRRQDILNLAQDPRPLCIQLQRGREEVPGRQCILGAERAMLRRLGESSEGGDEASLPSAKAAVKRLQMRAVLYAARQLDANDWRAVFQGIAEDLESTLPCAEEEAEVFANAVLLAEDDPEADVVQVAVEALAEVEGAGSSNLAGAAAASLCILIQAGVSGCEQAVEAGWPQLRADALVSTLRLLFAAGASHATAAANPAGGAFAMEQESTLETWAG
ncbi:hypothetical protein CYMTET_29210, partial [Cymbomonas tetramitiformis]